MGHDVCGFASNDGPRNEGDITEREEIAYLRRAAGNPKARVIYAVLGAKRHDCGCSGCGGEEHFTEDQLRHAFAAVPDDGEHDPERDFLRDCIEKGGGGAWVGFW